jgi:xanthine dehydrogenase accessory factor
MTMDGWDVLEHARELSERGEAFALATVVWRRVPSSGKQGCRAVVTASGQVYGWIGGACAEPAVVREARHVLADGAPRLVFLGAPNELEAAARAGMTVVPMSCQSEGALQVYIEAVEPKPHLVVVGRSPMALALVEMAQVLGWRTVLMDPDGTADRPSAGRVVNGLDFDAAGVGECSIVVVATQGHHDETAVEEALAAGPAYIGLVGSRRRGASVLGYLADRGVGKDALDRVRVPTGLDLGSVSHREIAVAILAELVQLRAAGALAPGVPAPAESAATEAVDPVWGMTVEVGSARSAVDPHGTVHYFCCPACHKAFEKDPAAFIGPGSGSRVA